jgi:thiol:disulfide interchange protein DsbD
MKRILLTCSIVLIGLQVMAQENPVKWTFDSKKTAAGAYEIRLNATVPSPWHIYSQKTPKGGPIPTKIQFKANPLVTLSDRVQEEGQVQKVFDKNFEVDVIYFAGDAKFLQTVKLKSAVKTRVQGSVEYMVCNDELCLQPVTVPFDILLN